MGSSRMESQRKRTGNSKPAWKNFFSRCKHKQGEWKYVNAKPMCQCGEQLIKGPDSCSKHNFGEDYKNCPDCCNAARTNREKKTKKWYQKNINQVESDRLKNIQNGNRLRKEEAKRQKEKKENERRAKERAKDAKRQRENERREKE